MMIMNVHLLLSLFLFVYQTISFVDGADIKTCLKGGRMTKECLKDLKDNLKSWKKSKVRALTPVPAGLKSNQKERDFETLLAELIETNEFGYMKELVPNLKKEYANITTARAEESVVYPRTNWQQAGDPKKQISHWDESDVKAWAAGVKGKKKLQENPKFLAEIMAVVMRGNELATGNVPRAAQVMAILVLVFHKGGMGRLIQMATGEGKSTICAMLATILALRGETVDVISSSPLLALRDAVERRGYFGIFGLTVDHNTELEESDLLDLDKKMAFSFKLFGRTFNFGKDDDKHKKEFKTCYGADILYGDLGHFQGDLLRHEFMDQGTRGKRKFENAIIDEVDSMLIDGVRHMIMLSGHVPGTEYLEIFLQSAWLELQKLLKEKHKDKNGKPEGNAFYKKRLISHLNNILREERIMTKDKELKVPVPTHLKEYALSQVEHWAASAIKAQNMVNKRDYLIKQNAAGRTYIAVVDYNNTGIIHKNMVWQNGLHQFIEMKHGLKMTAESFISCFMSNPAFFKRYHREVTEDDEEDKNNQAATKSNAKTDPKKKSKKKVLMNMFGMTGTIGSQAAQEFIALQYPIDFAFIPTYKKKIFEELPAIIKKDYAEWLKEVRRRVLEEARAGRAVLVINLTIDDAETINGDLIKKDRYKESKIRMYSRNDNDEYRSVKAEVDPGDIIIATNLAGRGTDIKTTPAVEAKGGLYVCVTFLPNNLRVELQAFGRTSRQGNFGDAQLILNEQVLKKSLAENLFDPEISAEMTGEIPQIEIIKQMRDTIELIGFETYEKKEMPFNTLKDEMFAEITELMQQIRQENKRKIREKNKEIDEENKGKKDKNKKARLSDSKNRPKYDQMQEHWGLELKKYEDRIEEEKERDPDEQQIKRFVTQVKQDFSTFKARIEELYEKETYDKSRNSYYNSYYYGENLFKNPSYPVDAANDWLTKGKIEEAIEMLNEAISLDSNYALPARYWMAFCNIGKVLNKFANNNSMDEYTRVDHYETALKDLSRAKSIIEETIIPPLKFSQKELGGGRVSKNDFGKQMDDKIYLFNAIVANIDDITKILNECIKKSKCIVKVNKYKSIHKLFKEKDKTRMSEIIEFMSFGLDQVYEVNKVPSILTR